MKLSVGSNDSGLRLTANAEGGALSGYLRAIRSHLLLVVVITLAAAVGCIALLARHSPSYTATAQLLISPLPQDDRSFLGVDFIRDSGDPTRTVQTAASVVDTPAVASVAARGLGDGWTGSRVRTATTVTPEGQSNILDLQATATSPELAARVADTYARAVFTARARILRPQVDAAIARTKGRLAVVAPNSPAAADLTDTLNQLESVQAGSDPTLRRLGPASVPVSANGAPHWLVIALATLAGFVLAAAAAILLELLDPRIRSEEEAVDAYPLPVLARVPVERSRWNLFRAASGPVTSGAIREGFRTLHVQLTQAAGAVEAIMLTSASAGDGKTTSAVNLGVTLAGAGHRVVLIDLDLRHPGLAETVGVESPPGLLSLIGSPDRLPDLLRPVPDTPLMSVVGAGEDTADGAVVEALTREFPEILAEAKKLADFVIVDTPPLGEVSDALRIAGHVDEIVVVTRLGNTRSSQFVIMRDLLDRAGLAPEGLVVIGGSSKLASRAYYWDEGRDSGSPGRPRHTAPSDFK
jgi:Mrp family chromosome partitioning ATPase/capsular polysaccharide biosynthesis protein